ncbi:MAG: HAMP domain-containing sensor histidine kinase [bacterium]
MFEHYKLFYRYGFLAYLIIYSLYVYVDYLFYPDLLKYSVLIRLVIGIPFLSLPIILSFTNYYKKHLLLINFISSTIVPVSFLFLIYIFSQNENDLISVYYGGLILQTILIGLLTFEWIVSLLSSCTVLFFFFIADKFFYGTRLNPTEFSQEFILLAVICLTTALISYFYQNVEFKSLLNDKALKQEKAKIEEQNIELSKINSTKDKFSSIIAHDLRGPMGTLMKLSAILSDEFDTFDKEDRSLFLKEIKESSENVYHLLENLLTWSRSQKGAIVFNPEILNLHNVVEDVLNSLRIVAATKKILITTDIPGDIMINADENMLKTVIRNFIGNSIKFTLEEGNILVTQKKLDGLNQISVTDNGIGMDEETLNKLFKIDEHQSSDGTAGEKGTGLGLILCKEFVEKHGGKVFVESEIGKGSTFSFTLRD